MFRRKVVGAFAATLMATGLMSPVASAQSERVVPPEERDSYVTEFQYDADNPPVVDGVGSLTDEEIAEVQDKIRQAEASGPPQDEIVPGQMWSDKVGVPEGYDKAEADRAEVAIAKEQSQPQARTLLATAERCKSFWLIPFKVCGEILDRYEALGGETSWLLLPIEHRSVNPDGQGHRQRFVGGVIYQHPDTGAHAVSPMTMDLWQRHGWEAGWQGYPLGGEVPVQGSNTIDGEISGWVQRFQGGRVYRTPFLEGFKVASINGLILEKWLEMGGPDSELGFPIADEAKTADGVGRFSTFQNGSIYWHPDHGAHPVSGDILRQWAAAGYENGSFGYPVSDPTSEDGIKYAQSFQGGDYSGYMSPVPEIAQAVGIPDEELDAFYTEFSGLMQQNGVNLQEGLATALEHAQYSAAETQKEIERLRNEAASAPSAGTRMETFAIDAGMANNCAPGQIIAPGNARTNPGDFFYSGATTSGRGVSVNHGHNGIFVERRGTTPDSIVTIEALNPTQGVVRVPGAGRQGVCNPRYFSVDTDNATRARAANFAAQQEGKDYNLNFALSRSATANSTSFNCSSLVWAAYMSASGGSLDVGKNRFFSGAYRAGVYPADLANSINTREFQ